MANRDQNYTFHGDLVRETEKAWLFKNDVDSENYWLPKSQCEWDPVNHVMEVPGWLVDEKEIPL